MWSRVIEFMLACWLAVSPFIFRHDPEDFFLWAHDLICATLIGVCALVSFNSRLHRAHLLILPIAAWLVARAFLSEPPPAPALQNHIVVGLLLLMLAVIPCRSSQPPRKWQASIREKLQA